MNCVSQFVLPPFNRNHHDVRFPSPAFFSRSPLARVFAAHPTRKSIAAKTIPHQTGLTTPLTGLSTQADWRPKALRPDKSVNGGRRFRAIEPWMPGIVRGYVDARWQINTELRTRLDDAGIGARRAIGLPNGASTMTRSERKGWRKPAGSWNGSRPRPGR